MWLGLHFVDALESFSQSYHQSRGAGYDPASWRVIALLVGGELRWWLLAWLMRGSGIGSSFIGLINFNFPWFGDGRIRVLLNQNCQLHKEASNGNSTKTW
jgi:hypothetical protein